MRSGAKDPNCQLETVLMGDLPNTDVSKVGTAA